jgi:hypothetical protein
VEVAGQVFTFDPDIMTVSTVRPDVFAPGYYSMFDVILTVAYWNGISVDYYYDSTCATHFITRINNITGNYWYHFSYDAGQVNVNEIQLRRANRWDEALWRPGVWIQLGNPYYEFENPTGIDDSTVGEDYRALTRSFNLHAPHPNPFNGSARITYNLFDPGHVVLDVYSLLGQRVARLLNRNEENIGVHELTWEPQNLPSGAYHLLMYFKGHQQVRRLSYIR